MWLILLTTIVALRQILPGRSCRVEAKSNQSLTKMALGGRAAGIVWLSDCFWRGLHGNGS